MKGIGSMTSIIITLAICVTVLLSVICVCNTAIKITKIGRTVATSDEMDAAQKKLDEEYESLEKNMLNLNNVLEALDDEYGKDNEE